MNRRTFTYRLLIALLFIIYWLCPHILEAHGTGYRILEKCGAVTVEFYYSTGEPISYARVLVFSPQNEKDEKVEYQNGRTDKQGRFAFYPNMAGIWCVKTNDGRGHMIQGLVEVKETKTEGSIIVDKTKVWPSSKLLGALLGVSLISNLCFIIYLFKRRQSRRI